MTWIDAGMHLFEFSCSRSSIYFINDDDIGET